MSLSRADFLIRFPEFVDAAVTNGPFIDAKLAEASRDIDAGLWAARADDGQGYLAAHLLALSPFGNAAKMVAKDGSTSYETHYKRLVRIVASGIRNT